MADYEFKVLSAQQQAQLVQQRILDLEAELYSANLLAVEALSIGVDHNEFVNKQNELAKRIEALQSLHNQDEPEATE